jgi:hypothetical protein
MDGVLRARELSVVGGYVQPQERGWRAESGDLSWLILLLGLRGWGRSTRLLVLSF